MASVVIARCRGLVLAMTGLYGVVSYPANLGEIGGAR